MSLIKIGYTNTLNEEWLWVPKQKKFGLVDRDFENRIDYKSQDRYWWEKVA